ncbi:ubulin-tyrosine ligase [Thraustotheca clavata]|uniref:Ubulin-tyrosine ligase n=1 Tax=Thraustotheca clavata TaxID=74557 RepID=A0A1V9ZYY0_9STRA|nr:ubulin-tyrosine ligase [Thraustotheca clavata]
MALTYNMESEFPELMQEYIRREEAGEDNIWICKPWNMARSLDTTIAISSANLAKLAQTGPKIACKYITRPLLIQQRKFDFRFLVMLVDTEPLQVYVSGAYWLRIANKPFSMDNFDDFQKHFTVMNYTEHNVEEMGNDEFERHFKAEYPNQNWSVVKVDILESIKGVFTAATKYPAPNGLGKSNKSRALYGVDVMLEWQGDKIHPVVLECNFHPDLRRASRYYPKFFNDFLNVLVLNKPEATVYGVTKL